MMPRSLRSLCVCGLFFVMTLPAAVVGCGYTTRSIVSTRYRIIHIEPFTNTIDFTKEADTRFRLYRPGLETEITRSVVNRFLLDGNLRPGPQEKADLLLTGELVAFKKDPVRYTDNDDVSEYRINIVISLTLKDTVTGKILWTEGQFTGDTTYFVSGAQAKSEVSAVNAALTDLARRVVERVVEDW
jgi:hypothetical protein